jgi:heat shock protein HtpX
VNNARVFLLMAALTALFGALGGAVAGQQGMLVALLLAAAMNFMAYFGSASMVLRGYRAQLVDGAQAPELHALVDRLRQRAGLPMPRVAVAPHRQPNAFATGRSPKDAVVCVTQGLLGLVSADELEGVLGHELGHVRHRDTLLQTVTATLAGATTNLARFGRMTGGRRDPEGRPTLGPLAILLAPLAAMLIQLGISRQREFAADRAGAEISGKPLALASALRKLEAAAHQIPMNVSPALAPVAQVDPLAAFGGRGLTRLFATHPSTQERVARLETMAREAGA